jgi:hypothetical protein
MEALSLPPLGYDLLTALNSQLGNSVTFVTTVCVQARSSFGRFLKGLHFELVWFCHPSVPIASILAMSEARVCQLYVYTIPQL